MEHSFDPHSIEQALYDEWENANYFAPSGNGPAYCIVIPPPNVTGSLHMGHAFQHTLMDALIRYHRMKGDRTLWQMGTDHAGISTQMLVERQLNAEGKAREEIGRDAFLERVWEWKKQSGDNISRQLRRMGSSLDWSRERFTMDEGYAKAVLEVFVRLFEDGLIYRGQRLVNWDPELRTAISDLEVENSEENGELWHFRYPLLDGAVTTDGRDYLVVATTRPETMLGDTAVAVHPDDERYRNLVGKRVRLPLVDREIPVIADDYVDPAFGTGCVKITPAHDFNDHEVGARHGLPLVNVLAPDASINDNAPPAYRGLGPLRSAQARGGRPRRRGPARRGGRPQADGAARRPLRRRRRAVSDRPVVREDPSRWRNRPSRPWRTARSSSCRSSTRISTSPGCATSRTGASRASNGGGTAYPPGTTMPATSTSSAPRRQRAGNTASART